MYEPVNLRRRACFDHYAGAEWTQYYSSGVGQSRDSSALERSNFVCMLKALGGESDTVIMVREGHWAVGWIEWIAIHETDARALEEYVKSLRRRVALAHACKASYSASPQSCHA